MLKLSAFKLAWTFYTEEKQLGMKPGAVHDILPKYVYHL
jgi:hypothetical protein